MTTTRGILVLIVLGALPAPEARGQIEPLLFLKDAHPNVLIAVDLSSRMQRDAREVYLDPAVFQRTGTAFEETLHVTGATAGHAYRRRYIGLRWLAPGSPPRGVASTVEAVGDLDPGFSTFDDHTRLANARRALLRVLEANRTSVRFGLLTSRQATPELPAIDWPTLTVEDPALASPTDSGIASTWKAGIPGVSLPGSGVAAADPVVRPDSPGASGLVAVVLAREIREAGALRPAGLDGPLAVDAPLGLLLDDLRAEAARLAASDTTCRNTVAVLLAAGADPALGAGELGARAASFVSIEGRRVPIHVVGLAPSPSDAAELRLIAARSGGRYVEVGPDALERPHGEAVVHEIVAAVNRAVQHALGEFEDVNVPPTVNLPCGRASEYQTASVVVGTVDLESAADAGGAALPATRVTTASGTVVPQPLNVMFTSGFELPGFLGRIRAFRVYRPEADSSRATGYRFVADGTPLWTASTPPADSRNIFTVLPGVGLAAFRGSNGGVLAPYLRDPDPAGLIAQVRAQPIGAIVDSTPALLEPPAMSWPSAAYRAFLESHRGRRTLLFVGAADGMLHAIDARTGLEVWAVIPFNLLPKLRALRDGQPIDEFAHFVGASPRLADVEAGGRWRTVLICGEGAGGTFYQAFDVSLDGLPAGLPPGSDDVGELLAWFADPQRVPFMWSFPDYRSFDPGLATFGDLGASATDAEKSVGATSSTPAVVRVGSESGPFVVLTGSGGLARQQEQAANRGGRPAGTTFYVLDAGSGTVLDSRDVGSDAIGDDPAACPSDGCQGLKNALHGDPAPASPPGRTFVDRSYIGDLDGRLWRFDLVQRGGSAGVAGSPRLLFSAGPTSPIAGGVARLAGSGGQGYLLFGTGTDQVVHAAGWPGSRLIGLREAGGTATVQFDRALAAGLPGQPPELVASTPASAGGVVFFATTTRRSTPCGSAAARLYALAPDGSAAYDTNGDHRRDGADGVAVGRTDRGRATAPFVAGRHVFVAAGKTVQVFGDRQGFNAFPGFSGTRVLTWREVR